MTRRKINMLSDTDWTRYKNIISDFVDLDAGKQPVLWLNRVNQMLPFGEDSTEVYIPTQLEALFQYNHFRTWPISNPTQSGELDLSTVAMYISAQLLRENGYLNEYGYWNFDWSSDRFVLEGKVYKPTGDTQVSQAKDQALLFMVVLQRENPEDNQLILESYTGNEGRLVTKEGTYILDVNGKRVIEIARYMPMKVSTDYKGNRVIKSRDGIILGCSK